MLVRFSRDVARLDHLAGIEIDRQAATDAVAYLIAALDLEQPVLAFSRRRRHADGRPTGTGETVWSVADLVAKHGETRVREWQDAGLLHGNQTAARVVKLGDPTLLASVAHEVAHLQVVERTPRAPDHGRLFVAALDEAAAAAFHWLRDRYPELSRLS